MFSGITRQALQRHRWTLLGPAFTQMLGACVISVMIMIMTSINHAIPIGQRSAAVLDVIAAGEVFLGMSIYILIAIVGVTMHIAMLQQMRDIALLRSVGATPGQVRRCLIRQVSIITLPSVALGYVLAIPAAALWLDMLKKYAEVPHTVSLSVVPSAFFISLGIGLSVAITGTYFWVLRNSRRPANTALVDSQTGNRPTSRMRRVIGSVMVIGGAIACVVLAQLPPEQSTDAVVMIIFAESIGIGMLTPSLLSTLSKHLGRLRLPNTLRLAVDDLTTITRSLSAAFIPLVLAISFAVVKVATITTMAHFGQGTTSEDAFTEYSGTFIYVAFLVIAALNCLITLSIARRRNLAIIQLAGGSRGQIAAITGAQTLVIALFGLVVGLAIAILTLFPIIHKPFGLWLPYMSLDAIIAGIVLTIITIAIGLVIPGLLLTRKRPIEVISTRD